MIYSDNDMCNVCDMFHVFTMRDFTPSEERGYP